LKDPIKYRSYLEAAKAYAEENSLQLTSAEVTVELMKFYMKQLDIESVNAFMDEAIALFKALKREDKVAEVENIYANYNGECLREWDIS
jgi:hypothetical protein